MMAINQSFGCDLDGLLDESQLGFCFFCMHEERGTQFSWFVLSPAVFPLLDETLHNIE